MAALGVDVAREAVANLAREALGDQLEHVDDGISTTQAALDITEAAAHREEVIRQIRTIRLEGKAAVRRASDNADVTAIAQPFIERLATT